MVGCSTSWPSSDSVSAPTGGSHTEKNVPAKNPARGCSVRAIHVYQPPAEGNTLASCAAESACMHRIAPPNAYAHGVAMPAKVQMKTKLARMANAGAIVAM